MEKPEPAAEQPGGRGDEYPISPAAENKIVGTMLNPRRRWRLEEQHKQAAIGVTVRNMASDDGRISNSAVSNLLKMEAQNQADELADRPQQVDLNVSGQVTLTAVQVAAKLREDERYVEYLESRALADDADPVRADGQPGPVADGPAPGGDWPPGP